MVEITLTDQNFKDEIAKNKLILVDFWAVWCPPCQMLGPIVEEVAKEVEGQAAVGKLNVDENPRTAADFKVMSIPTVILFKDGKVFEQAVGLRNKEYYLGLVKKARSGK